MARVQQGVPVGRPPKPCDEINTRKYGRSGRVYVDVAQRTDCEGRRLNPHPPYRCKRTNEGRCMPAARAASPQRLSPHPPSPPANTHLRTPCREIRANTTIESRSDRIRDLKSRCNTGVSANGKPCVLSKKGRCKEGM